VLFEGSKLDAQLVRAFHAADRFDAFEAVLHRAEDDGKMADDSGDLSIQQPEFRRLLRFLR
jgi:hypothetical protein